MLWLVREKASYVDGWHRCLSPLMDIVLFMWTNHFVEDEKLQKIIFFLAKIVIEIRISEQIILL